MNIVLFDSAIREHLLPLTFARPVGDLRLGILTIAEKWQRRAGGTVSWAPVEYLREVYPLHSAEDNYLIDGSLQPSVELLSLLKEMEVGEVFTLDDRPLIARIDPRQLRDFAASGGLPTDRRQPMPNLPVWRITRPADLFLQNDRAIREDYELLTLGRTSAKPSPTNTVIGPSSNLFLEADVTMEGCTLNVTQGPIYLGKDITILESCSLRGPLAVNAGAVIKMGAKIYGATTIGPSCKVGGEITNSVFQANSNKGHDGYLGNAVIGQWCNLGAGTNASNLKNDYGEVKVWSYAERAAVPSGLQFHGLIMGDHSKAGISTMFNTGTIVGFSANIFGAGFAPTFIPSFSWGGAGGLQTYRPDKAMIVAGRVLARRSQDFGTVERSVFERIFQDSESLREAAYRANR